jgi:hypothetical protein
MDNVFTHGNTTSGNVVLKKDGDHYGKLKALHRVKEQGHPIYNEVEED